MRQYKNKYEQQKAQRAQMKLQKVRVTPILTYNLENLKINRSGKRR